MHEKDSVNATRDLSSPLAGLGGRLVSARPDVSSADVLRLALTAPKRLTTAGAAVVQTDLGPRREDKAVRIALGALAALLYARPDLVRPSVVDALAGVMKQPI